MVPVYENDQKPNASILSDSPKRKPNGYKECMRLSHEQYKTDEQIQLDQSQPEVDYGRLRTISTEGAEHYYKREAREREAMFRRWIEFLSAIPSETCLDFVWKS